MGSDEVWARCAECGAELSEGERCCPNCGSTRKSHDLTATSGIKIKASLEAKHEAHWNAESYTILFSLLTFLTAAFYGILTVIPGSPVVKIPLAVAWLIVPVLLFWQKYRVLMCVRWLGRKFTAKKTFRSQ